MVTHSSILAWRIPWTEEPGVLSPWGHKETEQLKRKKISKMIQEVKNISSGCLLLLLLLLLSRFSSVRLCATP